MDLSENPSTSSSGGSVAFFEMPEKTVHAVKERRKVLETVKKKPSSPSSVQLPERVSGESDELSNFMTSIEIKIKQWLQSLGMGELAQGDLQANAKNLLERFKKQNKEMENAVEQAQQSLA